MKYVLLLMFVAIGTNAQFIRRIRRSAHNVYRMCVAQELLDICNTMAAQETKSTAKILCVSERDRSECIESVKHHNSEFIAVEPEDMYIAAKLPDQDFTIFEEIRTLDEPEAEFRYEGVVVIHKDLKLKNIKDLKGLKSCHTGVGRNVGYNVPLTKLKNMGLVGNLANPDLSPRENELKAFSTLFSKSCIVGKWSADPDINKKLKEKYNNLCAMCEDPVKCDYPDKFSGYDGALRCLAHNGGDIAFTKVIFVKKFFGLPVGKTPPQPSKENPDDFAYLCTDGSRVPIRGTPCTWAARPWPGYMSYSSVTKKVDGLRKKLENLYTIGKRINASWLNKVLEMSNATYPKETKIIGPGDYLDKANYTDILERDYGPPFKTVKFCVLSPHEFKKCRQLSDAAFSRNIRPRYDCVQERTTDDCFKAIRDGSADIISVSGDLTLKAQNEYNLKPILSEVEGAAGASYYAIALVKKNSTYKSFEDLRDSKSCHDGFQNSAGYYAPLRMLLKLGLIKSDQCPLAEALTNFFSGGNCVPGAKNPVHNLPDSLTSKLCSLCKGENESKCSENSSEPYFGDGAIACLIDGQGDVAFMRHDSITRQKDNPMSEDLELLCPQGGRAPIAAYEKCNLAHIPTQMIVTSNSKTNGDIEEIIGTLKATAELYGKRPELFKFFGKFDGQSNVLFKDAATGFKTIDKETELLEQYSLLMKTIRQC